MVRRSLVFQTTLLLTTNLDTLQPEWVGLVSGFDIGTSSLSDILVHMLAEYLTCEGGSPEDQFGASRISRLIIAGNSLAPLDLGSQVENISLDDKKGVSGYVSNSRMDSFIDLIEAQRQ